MRIAVVFAVLGLCPLVGPLTASAQTSSDIAASWGLLGEWQVQCGGTAGDDNPIYIFRSRGPQIILDRNFGTNRKDTQALVNLRLAPNTMIAFSVPFPTVTPPQTREHVWAKNPDGSAIRIITNRNADTGEYVVRDGKFSDGATTPWFNRCR